MNEPRSSQRTQRKKRRVRDAMKKFGHNQKTCSVTHRLPTEEIERKVNNQVDIENIE
jgi:hypothetical protein